jgi:hypothetical protein
VAEEKLYWFNRGLLPQGWLEHTEMTLGVAIEAHGRYAAVSLADSSTVIYDATRQRVRRFTSTIPLIALEFLVSRPAIVGVAEHGLLCCQAFTGEQEWKQTLWTSVGDLAVTGDGGTILLACYSQGIQSYDGSGKQVGSYQLDGTVSRISTSYRPDHLAAATQERQFFYLAAKGQVEFQAQLPDDACRVACDPLGTGVVLGLAGGEILRLDWGT